MLTLMLIRSGNEKDFYFCIGAFQQNIPAA